MGPLKGMSDGASHTFTHKPMSDGCVSSYSTQRHGDAKTQR